MSTRVAANVVLAPQWVVYKLYGNGNHLLYVGMTRDLRARLKQHKREEYWRDVKSVETEDLPDQESALEREAELIRDLSPALNVVGRKKWPDGPTVNAASSKLATCRSCGAMGLVWAKGRGGKPYLIEPDWVSSLHGTGIGIRTNFHKCPGFTGKVANY